MNKNLFIGNFPFETTQEELYHLFKDCGVLFSVKVLTDHKTGRSRGIGFVVMETEEGARAVLERFNGYELGGRKMFVVEAKPKEGEGTEGPRGMPPGFVERRSGKDRRSGRDRRGGARPPGPERREGFEKKPWVKRPEFKKKPWGGKPGFGDKKPLERKPWGSKPGFGEKKPFERKPWAKPGEGKPERKPWGDKPKRDWRAPGGPGRKPWAGHEGPKPRWGKPGFGKRKPPFGPGKKYFGRKKKRSEGES